MQSTSELKEKITANALQRNQLHDITTLTAALKRLLVNHNGILVEEGVRKELQQLENWLEAERQGPAPAGIISESGVAWLSSLRDRLKLSAEEALRLEGEGGNPSSQDQLQKIEELQKTVRRIDKIINESAPAPTH